MTTENKTLIGVLVLTIGIIIAGALIAGRSDRGTTTDGVAQDSSRLVRGDDPFQGPADAAVTVTEFGDFECSACAVLHPILKQVKENNADVKFVYRHFPLTSIHQFAQGAAEASVAAQKLGKFWEYHDRLYENQGQLSSDDLRAHAEAIGLSLDDFEAALNDNVGAQVTQDRSDGTALNLRGTPTLFVNDTQYSGQFSVQALQEAIDAAKE